MEDFNFEHLESYSEFDEDFYEKQCPESSGYFGNTQITKKQRLFHHYLNYGQHRYLNASDFEKKMFGELSVDESFDEELHERRYPEAKQYIGDFFPKRKRYYHHYLNYCIPGCDITEIKETKSYIKKIKSELFNFQDLYTLHEKSIVLVNHVSNPYGATHYLLSLYLLLKKQGLKVCILDELRNEDLYQKYQIDLTDVFSYEQDLIFLMYLYEKLKPKIFYLNSIRGLFVEFLSLKNKDYKVITHSHEIGDVYGRYGLVPTYVVSKRIQGEFEEKYNQKPEIQPPILLPHTLALIDEEFSKDAPNVSNNKGKMDRSKITVGMCGQTEVRKNPDLFSNLSECFPQYNFLWVGGEKGYFPEIDNLYHVPMTKLPFVYYKLFDYFLLTSQEDPCPYVVLENLFLNNKVITFKDNIYTDHKREIINDIYFEFDGGVSIESLKHVINEKVKEKANRIGNGRKYILDNFTRLNESLIKEFKK